MVRRNYRKEFIDLVVKGAFTCITVWAFMLMFILVK